MSSSKIKTAMEEALTARNAASDALLFAALGDIELEVNAHYEVHIDPSDTPLHEVYDYVLHESVPDDFLDKLRKLP